jgi:nicotinamidase-related amidase
MVDIQNDYFDGGNMPLCGMNEAAESARRLLEHFRGQGAPLVHVRHLSTRPGATFFIPDTEGALIHDSVVPAAGEAVVEKHFPSAFRDTPLHGMLGDLGVGHLVVCGAMTHMCIDTTVRAAFDLGYSCTVVSDAVATRDLEFGERKVAAADVQAAFLAALQVPFAAVKSADQWIGE